MGLEQHDETERKFDVGAETIFPALDDVEGVSAVSQPADLELEAVYFDTTDLDLARCGATLRRRTGGDDAGWHLKLPKARGHPHRAAPSPGPGHQDGAERHPPTGQGDRP